jgi:hypothetical protein
MVRLRLQLLKVRKLRKILGVSRTAYLHLKSKYEPSTTPQLMILTRDFHLKTLQHNQDPDIYITELEALKVKMGELDHEVSGIFTTY